MKLRTAFLLTALVTTPALARQSWELPSYGGWTPQCRGCAAQPPGWPADGIGKPVNPGETPKTIDGWTEPPLPPQPRLVSLSIIFGPDWYGLAKTNPTGITHLLPGAKLNKAGWIDVNWARFDPPVEFDHPYGGDLTIIKTSMQHVKEICPIFQPGIPPLACSTEADDHSWCRITVARDEDVKAVGWNPSKVLRHELAHCNGWPGTHPGARNAP